MRKGGPIHSMPAASALCDNQTPQGGELAYLALVLWAGHGRGPGPRSEWEGPTGVPVNDSLKGSVRNQEGGVCKQDLGLPGTFLPLPGPSSVPTPRALDTLQDALG